MSKRLKVKVSLVLIAMLIIGGVAMVILLPRAGKSVENIWSGATSYDDAATTSLIKNVGEDFRILQLTDLQFTTMISSKKKTKQTIAKLVEQTDPHLIVLTGDNVAGVTTHFTVDTVIEIMDEFKIPWAPVFGNHDRELNANLYYQAQRYAKSEYCLFEQGPSNINGVGNYIINIKEEGKHIYSVYMMDSNGNKIYNVDGKKQNLYEGIYPNQIEWYGDNVQAINNVAGKIVPSIAFFHVPLHEFNVAYDLAIAGDPSAELITGKNREDECPPYENTGLFDKMLELGSTTHAMVGHDHTNDYVVKYKGIVLGYGVKTGNHSYNDPSVNGGTLLTIGSGGVSVKNIMVAI